MVKDGDRKLTCGQCGREFVFTKAEQEFYELKGFTSPRRCRQCRLAKQDQFHRLICSKCQTELEKEATTYCSDCLTSIELEFELKIKQAERVASEAHAKLRDAESQKEELTESLRHKEDEVVELERKFDILSQDLEKAVQFHTALGWLEPTLKGMEGRLEALENANNKTNERMLQIVQKMHEMYDNTTLLEIIKRSLKGYQGKTTQPT